MHNLMRGIASILLVVAGQAIGAPTVFPTGTTLYDPARTWDGFTVLSILDTRAVLVIDMNGNVVKRWDEANVSAGGPARILPGGFLVAPAGAHPPHQESQELQLRDFAGEVLWRYRDNERIALQNGDSVMSARQHHDWQRPDFPAGYYSPDATPSPQPGTTLLLTHTSREVPAVADILLEDDGLVEIAADGTVLWEWKAADHIDEFGFSEAAREAIRRDGAASRSGYFDWLHVNAAHYVGPNHWYDSGDTRFAPDNVIISSRQASLVAIIARDGSVAWQLGPDVTVDPAQLAAGQIIGQHQAHMIPEGLPGAGNIMIYDNGGSSGYGAPSPIAPRGVGIYARATSRVIELDPTTLEVVWQYAAPNFFSTNISGAQRLPNGNTLITEGAPGRVFEVTRDGDIVWEYMNAPGEEGRRSNGVYRAYRIPYDWLPQVPRPMVKAVTPPVPGTFVLP